jgi:hypothetical protein
VCACAWVGVESRLMLGWMDVVGLNFAESGGGSTSRTPLREAQSDR